MRSAEIERRKYPRFNAEIPIDIGLIELKSGKASQSLKGVTTDISMEGLGLELDHPASGVLSFVPKLMGKNKEFDLDLNANLGTEWIKGTGEVRWARIYPPSLLKIGVFLKEMRAGEKVKWTDFVMRQSKGVPQDFSCEQTDSGHSLIQLLHKFIQDLIQSDLSINQKEAQKESVDSMEISDAELTCDYCLKKSGNPPKGWCKINEVGITVCPNCQLGHWEELKKVFLNDNLNIEYIE